MFWGSIHRSSQHSSFTFLSFYTHLLLFDILKADDAGDGNSNNWLVTDPVGWAVCYHELGHATLLSMYPGEVEVRCLLFCET
jgi:hypothetical protein